MEMLYEMGYGREKRYYKNSNYLGFGFFFIGIVAIAGNANIGYLLMILGLADLIQYYHFFFKQKKITQEYEEQQLEIVALLKENPKVVFEFNDEFFRYSDYRENTTIEWNEFSTFIENDENVFIITKNFQPFVLGKSEIGNENYNKILNFVVLKLQTNHSK